MSMAKPQKEKMLVFFLVMMNLRVGELTLLGCGSHMDYLVSGPRGIPDEGISASSNFGGNTERLKNSRLYTTKNEGAWSPQYKSNQEYIRIAFNRSMVVCSVLTQGRHDLIQWVTSYKVKYSTDGVTWLPVTNTENGETFQGNTDRSTVVRNSFYKCVEASYLKINPQTWRDHPSLRMDFQGCLKARSEFLYLKDMRKMRIWKRRTKTSDAMRQISQERVPHLGLCAMSCHRTALCIDYLFYPGDNICTLFQEDPQNSDTIQEEHHLYSPNLDYVAKVYDYETIQTSNDTMVTYKIITEKKTKYNTTQLCADDGARLLVINNLQTVTSIQQMIQSSIILAQETEYFVNGEYNGVTWVIETGEEIPAVLWPLSQPPSNNGNCVIITPNGLHTKDCNSQLYFVCEILTY